MGHAKIVLADLDFPRRELSVCVSDLSYPFWFAGNLIFRVFILGVQSSCTVKPDQVSLDTIGTLQYKTIADSQKCKEF